MIFFSPGKRWESWENQKKAHGYVIPRNTSHNSYGVRTVHCDFACLLGRYPYVERSMITVHEKSRHTLTSSNLAFLHVLFGLEFPSA